MKVSKIAELWHVSLIQLVKKNTLTYIDSENNWSDDKKCSLLENMLSGFPIGLITIYKTYKEHECIEYVLDGFNRLSTVTEAFSDNSDYYIHLDTNKIERRNRRKDAYHMSLKSVMDSVAMYKEEKRLEEKLGKTYSIRARSIAERFYDYYIPTVTIITNDKEELKTYCKEVHKKDLSI